MHSETIKRILQARVYDVAIQTPVDSSRFLGKRLDNEVLYKREDLQPVYSFKNRGAYNKLVNLTEAERAGGVIAASAGNHAQGVAKGATALGIRSIIVMPRPTPAIKVNSVRSLGGEVVLHGDTFDEAAQRARELCAEQGLTFIHPFDDPFTIAGQGTIGMEILRQVSPPIDAIFLPVGGGGIAAGVSAYIKYLSPETKIIAVEAEDSACLKAAMEAGKPVTLPEIGIFADGVAVATVGTHTFEILKDTVDEVVTCTTDEMCAAIKDIYDDLRSISEPAGALAVAGMKKYVERHGITGQRLVSVVSGANVNFDRLRHVSERAEIGERREAILSVAIPETPGSFRRFCSMIGDRNITEFNYRYARDDHAQIFVGLSLDPVSGDREALITDLDKAGLKVTDLTDNEVAKVHIRHMVGGHAPQAGSERCYRFQFPERPGALLKFLDRLGGRWNISAFHYRNHGAAYGRVLTAMQANEGEVAELEAYLADVGYQFWDESDNPAFKQFLGS
ncbi:MAG: threonine ammonia-lyase, biosynthetic [Litorivicinus sp.]